MADKRSLYAENEIIALEFDDGAAFECGIMGVFELGGKEYIALDSLEEGSDDVYLYEYVPTDDDFELLDIPEEDFDRVAAEFYRYLDAVNGEA